MEAIHLVPARDQIAKIKKGIPIKDALELIRSVRITEKRLAKLLGLSVSTLGIRKKTGSLTQTESERLMRLKRAYTKAVIVFDTKAEAARMWLNSPIREFGGETAMDMLETDIGASEVMNILGCIEHGLYS